MYKKVCCTCKVAFLLIRPIVVFFHRSRCLRRLRWCYTRRLATTIFSATQPWNIALQHCFEWLQHCSSIATLCCAKNRRRESSRVTSPLALHDFIFYSNKLLNIISRASLLALAKSIYYFSVAAGSRHLWSNAAIANGITYAVYVNNYVLPASKWSIKKSHFSGCSNMRNRNSFLLRRILYNYWQRHVNSYEM